MSAFSEEESLDLFCCIINTTFGLRWCCIDPSNAPRLGEKIRIGIRWGEFEFYSYLNATIGSTLIARRAGAHDAATTTAVSRAAANT